MRQTGLLAAAADFAIDNHWPLLENDHRRARQFAEALSKSSKFDIDIDSVQTNIILFRVLDGDINTTLDTFNRSGIAMTPFGADIIRATFHHQITDQDLDRMLHVLTTEYA